MLCDLTEFIFITLQAKFNVVEEEMNIDKDEMVCTFEKCSKLCSETTRCAYGTWFHLSFEHFLTSSMINKSTDNRKLSSIC